MPSWVDAVLKFSLLLLFLLFSKSHNQYVFVYEDSKYWVYRTERQSVGQVYEHKQDFGSGVEIYVSLSETRIQIWQTLLT